jgi:translocation and assembly module TamB
MDFEMKGSGTDLSVRGTVPVKSASPLDVSAKGTLDLALLKGFAANIESSGRIDLDVSAGGNLSSPQMRGTVNMVDARLSSAGSPVGFEMLNGLININGNRLELAKFSGNAGGGTVSGSGYFIYGNGSNFNMSLNANNVRVRYPAGVRTVVNGELQLNGTPASSVLSGRVLIDRLSFTQEFDMANFMGQFSGDSSASSPSAFQQNMKLNVSVQTEQQLNAQSTKLSIEGTANLTLGGTLATPVILGRTTLSSGDLFFLGKRYQVQNGTIEFANPVRTEPVVNLFVSTTVQQYNITLNFTGPMDRLRTNYSSTPALPPADIINLIAFGKTAEESAAGPSTPAALGAQSVLAKGVSSQVSGRLEKLAGISQLTIDPLAGTNPNNPGAQIAVQQRITGNLLLTFSTDVTSTQSQSVQLQYQASRNVSVSVLRDQNGGYAMDVRVRKNF